MRAVSNFFENSRRYSQLKVHHRCRWHRWQMAKIFKLKNFNYFVWTPLGSRVNIYIKFCLQVQFKMTAALYCTHYLPPVSLTPVANLPPASLIPVAICHRRRWHRWQICHRYQRHRWQIFPPFSLLLIPVANLPPVSTIPVAKAKEKIYIYVNSTTQRCPNKIIKISPWIFEKIRNGLNGILWGWGENDSWKKPEAKNLVTLSL